MDTEMKKVWDRIPQLKYKTAINDYHICIVEDAWWVHVGISYQEGGTRVSVYSVGDAGDLPTFKEVLEDAASVNRFINENVPAHKIAGRVVMEMDVEAKSLSPPMMEALVQIKKNAKQNVYLTTGVHGNTVVALVDRGILRAREFALGSELRMYLSKPFADLIGAARGSIHPKERDPYFGAAATAYGTESGELGFVEVHVDEKDTARSRLRRRAFRLFVEEMREGEDLELRSVQIHRIDGGEIERVE